MMKGASGFAGPRHLVVPLSQILDVAKFNGA
jgi:hypothetical protein